MDQPAPTTDMGKMLVERGARLLASGVDREGSTWYHYRDVEMLVAEAQAVRRVEVEARYDTLDEIKRLLVDASPPSASVAWSAIERVVGRMREEQ